MRTLTLALSLATLLASANVAADTDIKVNATSHQPNLERLAGNSDSDTTKTAIKKLPTLSELKQKSRPDFAVEANTNYWIFDSWVTYVEDIDYDGYYSYFSVEFDADTDFISAPVYAIVYLARNEIYDAIHVSSVFTLFSDSSDDSLIIESELVSGFVPADYDILIELYDADTDQLVAFTDGYEDADLAYVSLESQDYEYTAPDSVVIVTEHGGSLGWMSLLLVPALIFRKKAHR